MQSLRYADEGMIFMFRQNTYLSLRQEPVFLEEYAVETILRLSKSKFHKCMQDYPHFTRVDEILRSGGLEATDIQSPIKKNDKASLWVSVSDKVPARELTGLAVEKWKHRVREKAQQIMNKTFGRNKIGKVAVNNPPCQEGSDAE